MDTEDVAQKKKLIREEMLLKRKELNTLNKRTYDTAICTELHKLISKANVQIVHAYLPMSAEINIIPLLKVLLNEGKMVICPKTLTKRRLKNLILNDVHDIEIGLYKTLQPANTVEYEGPIDLIIVPGLAFDNQCYRVGYGSGYYDNFLAGNTEALKIGIFYPFQQLETVPIGPYDYKLDDILTLTDMGI